MAQVKSAANPVLEKGDIYFLYRPAVDYQVVRGSQDVRRLFLLLKPWGAGVYRVLVLGRKRLPDPEEHDRFWAFVWRIFKNRKELNEELGEQRYVTKTRGVRVLPAVRPVAEGVYAIVRHGEHTHLAYVLELPKRRGPAERELNIKREASYIISVKNPEAPTPPRAGLDPEHEAHFPKRLERKFDSKKWVPVDPVDFLNYEGAELVLIGAAEDPRRELGLEFRPDEEDEHKADVLRDLKLPRDVVREPLFEGRWR